MSAFSLQSLEPVHRETTPKAAFRLPRLGLAPSVGHGHSRINRPGPVKETGHRHPGKYNGAGVSQDKPLNCHRKSITVLLAEERTIVRQGIDALLAFKKDITVVGQAPDCRQVFEMAEKLRPDVVIIAISMALRNGLEAFRRILETRCGARVLVLVPHNDNPAFVGYVAAAGAAGYLTEQACSQSLATAVRKVHDQDSFFGQTTTGPAMQPRHGAVGPEKDVTRLTPREREVLQLIAEGNANKQTASKMSISIKTVEKHRQHLMDKLGIHETATLTRYAVYCGIAQ